MSRNFLEISPKKSRSASACEAMRTPKTKDAPAGAAKSATRLRTGPVPMERAPAKSAGFAAVFEAEEGPLLRFAFGICRRREVAEDVVQEAFLKLHSHWDEVDSHRAWLFRCVRNLALNHLRKTRREADDEEGREAVDAKPAPDAAVGRMEAAGMLRMLMAELPEKDRELVELKYEKDLKYKEISKRTGLSVGNIGYRLHHVLKGLAEALRRVGIEEAGV